MSLEAVSSDDTRNDAPDDGTRSVLSTLLLWPGLRWVAGVGLSLALVATIAAIATYAPGASEGEGLGSVALTLGLFMAAFVAVYALWRGVFWPSAAARAEVPWDTAFDCLPEAVFITSRGGRLAFANEAYSELLLSLGFKRTLSLSRLLARDKALGPTLYRLEVSARRGSSAREEMVVTGPRGGFHRWQVDVVPLSRPTRFMMWRITEVGGELAPGGHLPLADYLEGLNFPAFKLNDKGGVVCANGLAHTLIRPNEYDLVEGVPFTGLFRELETESLTVAAEPGVPALVAYRVAPHRNMGEEVSLWRVATNDGDLLICLAPIDVAPSEEEASLEVLNLDGVSDAVFNIMNNAPVSMALIGDDHHVIRANKTFTEMTGLDQVEGASLIEMVDGESSIALARLLDAKHPLKEGSRLPHISFSAIKPDKAGNKPVAAAFMTPVGATGRNIFIAFDISEQRKLENQFHQAQKMQTVGRLAGGIAHDFNNLLTAIIGFCDLLLVRHQVGDPSFADINQIRQNASRAASLTGQLLAFSRRQNLVPKVFSLTDHLSEVGSLLRRLVGEKIELDVIHGRDVGHIKADEGQITQVLTNLVVNARDAIGEASEDGSGKVTIRTRAVDAAEVTAMGHSFMPAAHYELIEVSDTGCGIPEDIQESIFEPFFTTKGTGEGTGLGLSTVWGIVKQTGGFLFVDSTVGEGTTFRIYLPTHAADAVKQLDEPAEPEDKDTTGQGIVLLVEDETAVRAFAARALTMRGYTVLEAEDGEDALRVLEEFDGSIDLVVSDVVMPGLDGPGLIEKLRADMPDLKVVFMSGYAEDSFRKQLEEAGGDVHFLPKPFSLPQLTGMVRKVMGTGAKEEAA